MLKFADNKDILKDYFQGLAYFVAIAGLLKAASIYADGKSDLYQGCCNCVSLFAGFGIFFAIHTCEQMVKVYFPDFVSPMKPEYIRPTVIEALARKDLWLFVFYALPYLLVGVEIVSISIQSL